MSSKSKQKIISTVNFTSKLSDDNTSTSDKTNCDDNTASSSKSKQSTSSSPRHSRRVSPKSKSNDGPKCSRTKKSPITFKSNLNNTSSYKSKHKDNIRSPKSIHNNRTIAFSVSKYDRMHSNCKSKLHDRGTSFQANLDDERPYLKSKYDSERPNFKSKHADRHFKSRSDDERPMFRSEYNRTSTEANQIDIQSYRPKLNDDMRFKPVDTRASEWDVRHVGCCKCALSPRDADDAVRARDGYDYDGYRLRVEFPRGGGGGGGRGRGGGGERFGARAPARGPPARRSEYRVLVTGLPPSGSWQDLKDHMREAGDVCFADTFKDGTGVVEFLRHEDMKYAVKKLDDSRFRSHEGEVSYIRVKEDYGGGGGGGGDRYGGGDRDRSRSYSPRRRGSPTYSPVRRSYSRERDRSRDRDHAY